MKEGVDFAIRFGPLTDSSLIGRRLSEAKRILVASPDYLWKHGEPRHPGGLADHNVIRFSGIADADRRRLTSVKGKAQTVEVAGNFQANHALAIRQAYLAGRGIGPAHYWLVADLIETGSSQNAADGERVRPGPEFSGSEGDSVRLQA